jgi:pyruvate/2-oxoglutarate dehydrogenase complex dihydrolipoamide acyltransferase (E2) component
MLTSEGNELITGVRVTDDELIVALVDGRTLSVPLVWYPNLLNASAEQRNDWQLIGDGEGVHWPQIDEDLSAAGLLRGIPAPAARPHRPRAEEIGAQAVNMAKDFYSASIGKAKSELQHDRSQLESLAEQILGEEAQAQIQEMVDSYTAIEESLDQAARDLGVEDVVNQAAQQAQEAAGEATQQAQETAGEVAQQVQETAGQVAQQVVDQASDVQKSNMRLRRRLFEDWVETLERHSGKSEEGDQPNATEAARRKAEELGIVLSQIKGTGSGGRILVRDVVDAEDRDQV